MIAGNAQQEAELPDLFSFETRRHRVVEWQGPGRVAQAALEISEFETMCAIRDGIMPPPPMARLIASEWPSPRPAGSSWNSIRTRAWKIRWDCSMARPQRLSWIQPLGCVITTMQPAGETLVTLDLKLTYLRPLSVRSGTISAEGKVVKFGRQSSYAEGYVRDGAGHLAVHATATFSMITAEKPK